MQEPEGLLDVIALGCVLEFSAALSRERYEETYDTGTDAACADRMQEDHTRTWFRVLMKTFTTKYTIVVGTEVVHASYLWHSVMVGFAAALVNYVTARQNTVDLAPGVTPESVASAVRLHLREDHPHLVAAFNYALEDKRVRTSLTWDGPAFKVVSKSDPTYRLFEALGILEDHDLAAWPLHAHCEREGEETVNKYYEGVWPGEDAPHDT